MTEQVDPELDHNNTDTTQMIQQALPLAFVRGEAVIEKPQDLFITDTYGVYVSFDQRFTEVPFGFSKNADNESIWDEDLNPLTGTELPGGVNLSNGNEYVAPFSQDSSGFLDIVFAGAMQNVTGSGYIPEGKLLSINHNFGNTSISSAKEFISNTIYTLDRGAQGALLSGEVKNVQKMTIGFSEVINPGETKTIYIESEFFKFSDEPYKLDSVKLEAVTFNLDVDFKGDGLPKTTESHLVPSVLDL